MTSVLLPSSNGLGIPNLRLDVQPTGIPVPCMPWGSVARGRPMLGTWHFFVDDTRFGALLKDPAALLATGCAAVVEPNITTYEQSPRIEVLWSVHRKRCFARTVQDMGLPVFVDVNVPRRFHADALLGVPRGWKAFATRGYAARPDDLRAEHDLACDHARGVPLLLVVGGGRGVEALTRTLPGCVFVPDFSAQRRAVAKPLEEAATGTARR